MGNLTLSNGYGVAGFNVVTSLQRLGHDVFFANKSSPVEIAFSQPDYSDWSSPDAYHIQYTPWESDELPDGWVEAFNDNCDEVWTTSPLIAKWYADAGVTKPIKVYQHGIEDIWLPKRRKRGSKLKFLHVGEPAGRKGGQDTLDAFREVFGDRSDVHLTIKAWTRNTTRAYAPTGQVVGSPHIVYNNVSLIHDEYTPDQMVQLFHDHDVLVYPGWGEGFGLIPLQALATGMPTICTEAWAPYAHHILPSLALSSELISDHPWTNIHKGKMFRPSFEDLKRSLKVIDDSYEVIAGKAFKQSFYVTEEYNWDRLTEEAFRPIVERFG